MKVLGEYGRYLMASFMVLLGMAGMAHGGFAVWLGLATFFVLALLDFLSKKDVSVRGGAGKWFYDGVLYLPLVLLYGLWILFAQRIAEGQLGLFNAVGAIISVSFLTALAGLPTAHELMHRKHPLEILGSSLYLTLFALPMNDLYHVHGHHPFVGTLADSDTPRRGQTVYGFVYSSLFHGTVTAYGLEKARLAKQGHGPLWWKGRVTLALLCVATWVSLFCFIAGPMGIVYLLATLAISFIIIGGFNYTQHYGIVRAPGTPLLPHHSWNHLNTFSRAITFEISNHSEHHLDPDKAYELLKTYPEAPQMPSIIICFLASFIPPLWEKRIAKPLLTHWDTHYASPAEQRLAMEENARAGWPIWVNSAAA
ncbi:MAG: fatty acid desaturase [Rugosibacter sp.]|jgi:alkane 1-monooxygenase|nr:fatty acid desaturase [Rugosibacter sp.]